MRTTTAWVAKQEPRRLSLGDPAGSLRRGELAAGLATAAFISQLLFAPVTLLIALLFVAVGRVSRWRPQWLLVLAAAGLIWLLEAGAADAVAGFAASSGRLAGYLHAVSVHPARLAHPGMAFASAGTWLPAQLPLALLAAAGEASLVLWIGWWRAWAVGSGRAVGLGRAVPGPGRALAGSARLAAGQRFRPGLMALVRRRLSAAVLSAGHTVTLDGCALGLQADTGRLAGFSWAAAEHGVLLTGGSRPDLDQLGLAAVCAALRLRKTLVVADLTATGLTATGLTTAGLTATSLAATGPAATGLAGQVTALATSVGVATSEICSVVVGAAEGRPGAGQADAAIADLIGRAVRRRGVVVVSAHTADAAQRVIDDLASVLVGLRDLGLRADCLVWISGCAAVDADCLAGLERLGPATRTAVLLSTTSAEYAVGLATLTATIVATGPISSNLAAILAGNGARPTLGAVTAENRTDDYAIEDILRAQVPGAFTILAGMQPAAGEPRATASCRAVAITPGSGR